MGRGKALTRIHSTDPILNRLQDHLKEVLSPVLSNPLINAADWRLAESDGSFLLQHRSNQTWTTVATFNSAGDLSTAISQDLLSTAGDLLYASAKSTAARLGIGSPGQVLTVSGGMPAWAAAAAGGGWVKSYSVDYTALATQNFITGGDGTKTIDGKPCNVTGTANAATAGITNGTGIVLKLSNNNTINIECRLTALVPALNPLRDDVLVMARIVSNNTPPPGWHSLGITLGDQGAGGWYVVSGPRNDSGAGTLPDRHLSQTGGLGLWSTTASSGDDVIALLLKDAVYAGIWSGVYSGGFPSFVNLPRRGGFALLSSSGGSTPSGLLPNDVSVFLRVASATNAQATFTHLDVWTRQ